MRKYVLLLPLVLASLSLLYAQESETLPVSNWLNSNGIVLNELLLSSPILNSPEIFVPVQTGSIRNLGMPLSIGQNQLIPSVESIMSIVSSIEEESLGKVLIIGVGCGYIAGLLANISEDVYIVELNNDLYRLYRSIMINNEIYNTHIFSHYPSELREENGLYDLIIYLNAQEIITEELFLSLNKNGSLFVPLLTIYGSQEILLIKRNSDTLSIRDIGSGMFTTKLEDNSVNIEP